MARFHVHWITLLQLYFYYSTKVGDYLPIKFFFFFLRTIDRSESPLLLLWLSHLTLFSLIASFVPCAHFLRPDFSVSIHLCLTFGLSPVNFTYRYVFLTPLSLHSSHLLRINAFMLNSQINKNYLFYFCYNII